MEFLLVRHAQPAWIVDGRWASDPGLTELGHAQAAAMARAVADEGADEVWISPLTRARQTAEPLVAALGIEPRVEAWLAEAGPPQLGHVSQERAAEVFATSRYRSVHAWWAGLLGSEPLADFVARVASGLERALVQRGATWTVQEGHRIWHDVPRDGRIAIVSHAGTSAAVLAHLLDVPQVPWAWERFLLDHAAAGRVRTTAIHDGVVFGLRQFSFAPWLSDEQRTR